MTMDELTGYYEKQVMTLFDHYAALALAGLIANEGISDETHDFVRNAVYSRLVVAAFEIADTAMAQRDEYGLEK